MPRIQMDFLPALSCGAHCLLLARRPPVTVDDNVLAGRAMQRFWLTATRIGLMLQPEMTPLIFGRYGAEGRPFSSRRDASALAQRVGRNLASVLGNDVIARGFFMGRIGHGQQPKARSLRRDLWELQQWANPNHSRTD